MRIGCLRLTAEAVLEDLSYCDFKKIMNVSVYFFDLTDDCWLTFSRTHYVTQFAFGSILQAIYSSMADKAGATNLHSWCAVRPLGLFLFYFSSALQHLHGVLLWIWIASVTVFHSPIYFLFMFPEPRNQIKPISFPLLHRWVSQFSLLCCCVRLMFIQLWYKQWFYIQMID